jgi:hypothetical protein
MFNWTVLLVLLLLGLAFTGVGGLSLSDVLAALTK